MTPDELRLWRMARVDQRTGRPWSQPRAAEWFGCDERTWRRWEIGESRIPRHLVVRIQSDLLGHPVHQTPEVSPC